MLPLSLRQRVDDSKLVAASVGSETKKNQCLQCVCETGSLLETRSQFNFCFVRLLRQVLFGDTFSLFREVYDSVLTKKKKTRLRILRILRILRRHRPTSVYWCEILQYQRKLKVRLRNQVV